MGHKFHLQNRGFATAPRKVGRVPEGGEGVATIIADMELRVSFHRWAEPLADGSVVYTVYVYRPGSSCFRKNLGRLSELTALDEETIRTKITALFPRGTQDVSS